MKNNGRSRWLLIFVALLGLFASELYAADAMYKMAEVMHRLKHFPSPQGKAVLQGIVQNEKVSKREKIIAQSMLNLQHKVIPEDVPKLNSVMNLNHRPSKADKEILKAIMEKHK